MPRPSAWQRSCRALQGLLLFRRGGLAKRFRKIGDPAGCTLERIINCLGKPASSTILSNHRQLLQWTRRGQSISIVFDNDGAFCYINSVSFPQKGTAPLSFEGSGTATKGAA